MASASTVLFITIIIPPEGLFYNGLNEYLQNVEAFLKRCLWLLQSPSNTSFEGQFLFIMALIFDGFSQVHRHGEDIFAGPGIFFSGTGVDG